MAKRKAKKKDKDEEKKDLQVPEGFAKKLQDYTPKQAAFYYFWSQTGNRVRSALMAYYPDFPIEKGYSDMSDDEKRVYSSAASIANENLKNVENPLQLVMEERGLDFGRLAEDLERGLEATKTTNAAVLLTKDGETAKAEEQGLIEVPDMPERREWWDRFARILGVDASEVRKGSTVGVRAGDSKIEVVISEYESG